MQKMHHVHCIDAEITDKCPLCGSILAAHESRLRGSDCKLQSSVCGIHSIARAASSRSFGLPARGAASNSEVSRFKVQTKVDSGRVRLVPYRTRLKLKLRRDR
jgi:predicted RNA-binding Zn-ribbon protein involved in translation (DUF1610 family)